MAKAVLIVRGSLGAGASSDVAVVQNPQAVAIAQKQEMPSSLNADDLMFTPPGSTKEVSLKAFKEQVFKKEGG